MNIKLYTTLGCHLCEEAKQMLLQARSCAFPKFNLDEVEIANSAELMANYGTRIPVVSCVDATEELPWPFTLARLEAYLNNYR